MYKDWDSAEVRFTMAYPEIYEVGASNLGHVVLYTILNQTEGLLCDRSYLPGEDMESLMKSKGRTLFAVESKRPSRTLTRSACRSRTSSAPSTSSR